MYYLELHSLCTSKFICAEFVQAGICAAIYLWCAIARSPYNQPAKLNCVRRIIYSVIIVNRMRSINSLNICSLCRQRSEISHARTYIIIHQPDFTFGDCMLNSPDWKTSSANSSRNICFGGVNRCRKSDMTCKYIQFDKLSGNRTL